MDNKKELRQEVIRFYNNGFDNLLKIVIDKIVIEANKAKIMKETSDQTALNLARQEGVIEGVYKILRYLEDFVK